MQKTALQYFDPFFFQLQDGILDREEDEEVLMNALLNRLTELDEANVTAIARTLSQASLFNEIVREQVSSMKICSRVSQCFFSSSCSSSVSERWKRSHAFCVRNAR